MADNRTNLWTFCIYPGDSAPENFFQVIQNWHIPCLLSPTHDPEDEDTKDHIHVMMYFGQGQKKSYEQVMEYVHQVNGSPAKRVDSRNGLTRYFIHYDDPEKQQGYQINDMFVHWSEKDLICVSGFEIGDAFGSFLKDEEFYKYIEDLIIQHKIINMADLILFLKTTNCFSELSFLRRHTYYFDRMLDGMYRRLKKKKSIDKEE